MAQRSRRMQQTTLGQSVDGDYGDPQINGRLRAFEAFFLNRCFCFRTGCLTVAALLWKLAVIFRHENSIGFLGFQWS